MATIDVFNPARDVLNQAPSLHPINLFDTDVALGEALEREGGGWGVDRVREAGAVAGSVETLEHGRRAERNLPILRTHDRYGNRIDEVELIPRGTCCCAAPSSGLSTRCRGASRSRERTWSARRCSACGATPTTASCVRCR